MIMLIKKNWQKLFIICLILPIILNLILYFFFNNLSFLIIAFNILYYLVLIFSIYELKKYFNQKGNIRSPFEFIKKYNSTRNKNHWDEFQKPLKHLVGIEIGVMNGDNAQKIVDNLNIKEIYLSDPWKEYIEDFEDLPTKLEITQAQHEKMYEHVKKRFKNYKNVKIIRRSSIEVSKMFTDNYFDFIYIDADHSYKEIKKDLEIWHPKLKKYGVMCGDDFGHISGRGVIEAVQEFAYEKKLIIQTGADRQFWYVKTK